MYQLLLYLAQAAVLLLFLLVFYKFNWRFFSFATLHVLAGWICYSFDFQPWIIEFFILIWVISSYFIFRNKYLGDLKRWVKVALVAVTILHVISWGDAFHERLIHAGLFYSHLVTNVVIDKNYTIQGWKSFDRPYYFNLKPHTFISWKSKTKNRLKNTPNFGKASSTANLHSLISP